MVWCGRIEEERKVGGGGEEAGAGTEMGCRGECTVGILAEDRRKVISSWALLAGVALASMGRWWR